VRRKGPDLAFDGSTPDAMRLVQSRPEETSAGRDVKDTARWRFILTRLKDRSVGSRRKGNDAGLGQRYPSENSR
jgi:hypothetical protein